MEEGPAWSALPNDLVFSIAEKLGVVDFIALCGVCRAWRSAAKSFKGQSVASQPPLLIAELAFELRHPFFYSLSERRLYKTVLLDNWDGKKSISCVGYSQGFIILVYRVDPMQIHLVNPFSRAWITGPPIPSSIKYALLTAPRAGITGPPTPSSIKYALLTAPLSSPDCFLLTFKILSRTIQYCRLGDSNWEKCKFMIRKEEVGYFENAVLFNGKVYAVDNKCNVVIIELTPQPEVAAVRPQESVFESHMDCPFCQAMLVATGAELLLIYIISFGDKKFRKKRIRAFRLDPSTDKWVKVVSLGDRTVFVSHGMPGAAIDGWMGRHNCIYYADLTVKSLTIFSLEHDSVEYLPLAVRSGALAYPFWVVPKECF